MEIIKAVEDLGRGCVDRKAIDNVFETVEFIVASILQSALQKQIVRCQQVLCMCLRGFAV